MLSTLHQGQPSSSPSPFISVLTLFFLQKHVGLLSLLEEESALPTTTDTTLVAKFHHHWEGKSPHYLYVKQQAQSSFGISHYAGEVMYNVSSFLEKNRDSINPDVIAIFWESKSKIVATLFKTPSQPESIGKKMTLKVMKKATHKGTVAGHFKVNHHLFLFCFLVHVLIGRSRP